MSRASASMALMIFLTAALTAASLPAAAGDFDASSVTPRELVHCMMKRMKADRTQSYRTVFQSCRQELEAAHPATPAADTAMNTGTGAQPAAAPKQ